MPKTFNNRRSVKDDLNSIESYMRATPYHTKQLIERENVSQ